MTVAPIKSKVHEVQIQGGAVHFNVNIYNNYTYTCEGFPSRRYGKRNHSMLNTIQSSNLVISINSQFSDVPETGDVLPNNKVYHSALENIYKTTSFTR